MYNAKSYMYLSSRFHNFFNLFSPLAVEIIVLVLRFELVCRMVSNLSYSHSSVSFQ